MRALETGRWVLRAASTGISGIIAPDGRYTERTQLGEVAIVDGNIGTPVDTVYDAVGGNAVATILAVGYAGAVVRGRRKRRA